MTFYLIAAGLAEYWPGSLKVCFGSFCPQHPRGDPSTDRLNDSCEDPRPTIPHRAEWNEEALVPRFRQNALELWSLVRPHAEGRRGFPASERFQIQVFRGGEPVPCPSGGADGSYRNLLYADEFKRWAGVVIFQAKLDHFADTLHKDVQILGLSMATAQGGDGSDIVAIFVALNNYRELPLSLHDANSSMEKTARLPVRVPMDPYPPSFSKNKQIVSIPR